jgi:ribosomal protein S18 acetylase RimI-like enzyme
MFEIAMLLHRATSRDAPRVAELVNAAFNGNAAHEAGWTFEDGFFEGDRIDVAEVLELIAVPGSQLLLWIADREVSGCAYLKPLDGAAYLGLLAVRPGLQDRGIGSAIIAECERIVRAEWKARAMRISVITSHRPELTAFYERRGYVRTGRHAKFERKQALRAPPRMKGLQLEWMQKDLH